ncbi:hypothetical protein [Rubrivirga sp.]|uniref:hypothetical protein n=1 Tax=Rubrivirga sp. TaxID=1885344 RepID=UPI003C7628C6
MRLLALALLVAASPHAQQLPAVDVLDLMRIPFNDDRGTFLARGHEIGALFPTDGDYQLAVLDAAGTAVATMRYVPRPYDGQVAFAELEPRRDLVYTSSPEPGAYRLAVVLDGDVVGAVPFTLSAQTDDDPFAPSTTWQVEGPWRTTALLSVPSDDPDGDVTVWYWLDPADAGGESVRFREVLTRDGLEVEGAGTDGMLFASFEAPFERSQRLGIDRGDLEDGDYDLEVVTADGRTLRSFGFRVEGGVPVAHSRSALDTPRDRFLTPRAHRRSDQSGGWNGTVDRVWMTSE